MTLVSDIIRDAFCESLLIGISEEPTAAEATEGLRLLSRYIKSVYGNEAGEKFIDTDIGRNGISRPSGYPWYENAPPGDWIVPPSTRLFLNLTDALTVYLTPNPMDGQRFAFTDSSGNLSTYPITIEGNGRKIGGASSLVVDTDDAAYEYIYRADTGTWAQVTPLELYSEFPFPEDFDDMFVVGLAMRINPRNNVEIDPQSVEAFRRSRSQFRARYHQTIFSPSELALLRTTMNRYRYIDGAWADAAFNSGRPFNYYGY